MDGDLMMYVISFYLSCNTTKTRGKQLHKFKFTIDVSCLSNLPGKLVTLKLIRTIFVIQRKLRQKQEFTNINKATAKKGSKELP